MRERSAWRSEKGVKDGGLVAGSGRIGEGARTAQDPISNDWALLLTNQRASFAERVLSAAETQELREITRVSQVLNSRLEQNFYRLK